MKANEKQRSKATTNTTVNPIIQDAKKTFLEERRASPDLIKKRMDDSVDTEDEDEPMESLLVDHGLDEIFNENKKAMGRSGASYSRSRRFYRQKMTAKPLRRRQTKTTILAIARQQRRQ